MAQDAVVKGSARGPIHHRASLMGQQHGQTESPLVDLLPRVRNLVRYLVRGDADVEDISQEALIALLHGLPTYRGEGLLSAWVDRVVARTAFLWLRRKRDSHESRSNTQEELGAVPSEDTPLDEHMHHLHVVTLLDRIPTEQRHALVLHHVMEMSVPEIASELSIPLETVRSRLRLGRATLRELAEKEEAEVSLLQDSIPEGP